MKAHHPLVLLLGFTAFAMNPALACSSSDTDAFEYGEAEMVAAVQGTWRLTYTRPEGTSVVIFDISAGPKPNGALAAPPGLTPQCETRTFTRPAAACSPSSQLALTAAVTEANPPLDATDGKGWYTIRNLQYVGGFVELTFDPNLRLSARLDAKNAVAESNVAWRGTMVTSVLERASAK
jgi:hypothetical protein